MGNVRLLTLIFYNASVLDNWFCAKSLEREAWGWGSNEDIALRCECCQAEFSGVLAI